MKLFTKFLFLSTLSFCVFSNGSAQSDKALSAEALKTMKKATVYFRTMVATNGGYLYNYKDDFTMREGEEIASPTTIWIQPPGTPAVGMAYLDAYEVTGDTLFLNGAIKAARALVWGQLASGGWDYPVDFDPVESKKWYFRRDLEAGDTDKGRRRNRTTFDDNVTQSALSLLMRTDKVLKFRDKDIHNAAMYCINSILNAQYPNGAWPQGFTAPPDPMLYPVKKASYPAEWSRVYPAKNYSNYYTFNDNTICDVLATMMEAYKTYGDERCLNSAKRCGDFMILAQMPDPQPAWAQQYNENMEPSWARKFEPPSITGGETFGILYSLIGLYLNTGEKRFLEPVPKALEWAKRSKLPDGRLARFYELRTNKPLYFNAPRQYSNLPEPAFPGLGDYSLIYEDTDLPNHYSFKTSSAPIESIEALYKRALTTDRKVILAEQARISKPDPAEVRAIIESLDEKGRWLEKGRLKVQTPGKMYVDATIISCQTFNHNLSVLTNYLRK